MIQIVSQRKPQIIDIIINKCKQLFIITYQNSISIKVRFERYLYDYYLQLPKTTILAQFFKYPFGYVGHSIKIYYFQEQDIYGFQKYNKTSIILMFLKLKNLYYLNTKQRFGFEFIKRQDNMKIPLEYIIKDHKRTILNINNCLQSNLEKYKIFFKKKQNFSITYFFFSFFFFKERFKFI